MEMSRPAGGLRIMWRVEKLTLQRRQNSIRLPHPGAATQGSVSRGHEVRMLVTKRGSKLAYEVVNVVGVEGHCVKLPLMRKVGHFT
jgi:hypothetical protein